MFSVTVRDHILVAHSLGDEVFGPARNLHGATYVIDAEFRSPQLDEHSTVIDIGAASRILGEAASHLNYRNLDDMEEFQSQTTTAEFLAKYLFDEIGKRARSSFKGFLKVTIHESPVAWASYEGEVR
jgi:6-pyruvoyltetrahydropterin/6-carboxytetrahydropterin synthase